MEAFERKKITFEVVTPLFIGSGEEYDFTESVVENGVLKIIDRKAFHKKIMKDQKLYEQFLNVASEPNELYSFLKMNAQDFFMK